MISHLWQSTLFAAAAGLLTLSLKRNRARTRYWVWMAWLVKFLVPFGVLVSLGGHLNLPLWTPVSPLIVEPAISFVMGGDIGEPASRPALTAPHATHDYLLTMLVGLWVVWIPGHYLILGLAMDTRSSRRACGFTTPDRNWDSSFILADVARTRSVRHLPASLAVAGRSGAASEQRGT